MKPPRVEAVTSPKSHNTNKITKIVQSMCLSFRCWMQVGPRADTAPPSYAVVARDLGPCEQHLRYAKLASSSRPGFAWTIFKLLL
jgi:hypothetical protein